MHEELRPLRQQAIAREMEQALVIAVGPTGVIVGSGI